MSKSNLSSVVFLVSDASDASSGSGSETRRRGIYGTLSNSTNARASGRVKFTVDEIYKATKNFSPTLKVGQGGFGTVYKGRLEDGNLVAIKRAKSVHSSAIFLPFSVLTL